MSMIVDAQRASRHKLMLRIALSVTLIALVKPAFAEDPWAVKAERFQVLQPFGGLAVMDQETGLVWERSPSGGAFTWDQAHQYCNSLVIGARMGWRLPTLQELTSILSIGAPNNLEPGNPFNVIPPWNIGEVIWSATTSATSPTDAWTMNLASSLTPVNKGALARCWCVRFRQGVDPQ